MNQENQSVLLVGWGFPPKIDGGLDIHVKHLFEQLESRGLDVTLALPEENAPERQNIVGLETGEGDMIQRSREMSAEIAKIAGDYDIVHTHDWFGAEAGFKAKKYSEASWVSTLHSLSSSRSRNSYGRLKDLEKIAVEESDELIAVSKKLADKIGEKYRKSPEVIHNGFSRPESSGKDIKDGLDIKDDMIFFVGRHAEQKGLEHLLYGFKKFLEDEDATLVIGGEGHMTEALQDFTEILDIKEKVVFTGFIPDRELGDYYNSTDIFVSPSINEPFGLTITEALNSGTPVVATDNGVKEIIDKNYLTQIEPESDSIARGLKEGLKKDFTGEIEGRSWEEMTDEILDIYRSI